MFIEVFWVFVTSVLVGLFQIFKFILILPITIGLLVGFWIINCYEKLVYKRGNNENS